MSDSTETNCSVAKKSTKNVIRSGPFDFPGIVGGDLDILNIP